MNPTKSSILTVASCTCSTLFIVWKYLNYNSTHLSNLSAIEFDITSRVFQKTLHITVRPVSIQDCAELYHVIDTNRAFLRRWLPWPDKIINIESEKAAIENIIQGRQANKAMVYVITLNSKIIGSIGFNFVNWKKSVASIGYWLVKEYNGNGIMTQCVKQLISVAFETLNVDHIHISADSDNTKSRAIPQRLKLTQMVKKRRDEAGNQLVDYILTRRDRKPKFKQVQSLMQT